MILAIMSTKANRVGSKVSVGLPGKQVFLFFNVCVWFLVLFVRQATEA